MNPMRISPRTAFWALAGVSLLLGHDAVWLVQVGPGEDLAAALRGAQHGYWAMASLAIVAVAIGAALLTALRTLGLARRARQMAATQPSLRAGPFLRRAATAWVRLFAIVAIGFVLQESVEHFVAHGHALGIGALVGPEYPLAVPVLAAVTAGAALIAALVRSVERGLLAGIAAALRRRPIRAPRTFRRPLAGGPRRRASAMAACEAGRAPPALLVGT